MVQDIFHTETTREEIASLVPIYGGISYAHLDEKYPLVLITGRIREHYNNGSMTRRSQGIAQIVPAERVEISREDAESLGIKDRNWVIESSSRGEVKVRANVTI